MDLFDLTGKVAVVSGGARGIGLMMARGLLQAGASVYISSRKAEAGQAAAAELSTHHDAHMTRVPLAPDLVSRGHMLHQGPIRILIRTWTIPKPTAVLRATGSRGFGPWRRKGDAKKCRLVCAYGLGEAHVPKRSVTSCTLFLAPSGMSP